MKTSLLLVVALAACSSSTGPSETTRDRAAPSPAPRTAEATRTLLRRVLAEGALACTTSPARCIVASERRGDGGGTQLGYQVLTPGGTLDSGPVCDGDMAECDDDAERATSIDRAVDALLAGAGDLIELTATPATDDTVALPLGTVAIHDGTLRVGTRTLDADIPATTTLVSAAASPDARWLVATLDIAPEDGGRAGALVVSRMYELR